MTEINRCPSTLMEGFATYSPKGSKKLFSGQKVNPILEFNIDEFRNTSDILDAIHRISVSGVQEKFPAIIDQGRIRISLNEERSTYILKPAPWDKTLQNRKQIPANEHITMQIASQVYGIQTAANGDAHLKNFSLILQESDYRLAPAYDLLNTGLHVNSDDFGLDGGLSFNIEKSDIMAKTGHPCRLDFERFGKQIGIVETRLKRILGKYMQIPDETLRLIDHSFLNDKMKRTYIRIINERISRFIRISE